MLLKIMWEGYSHQGMQGNRNKCKLGEAVNKLKEKKKKRKAFGGVKKRKTNKPKKTSPTTERGKAVFSLLTTLGASSKSKIR